MNQIPLDLLYSFLVFADSPSINSAAKRLGITQPALTKQLQRLEATLPQTPFMAVGRQKVLNRYGQDLHKSVKAVMQTLDLELNKIHHGLEESAITYKIGLRREILERLSPTIKIKNRVEFVFGQNDDNLRQFQNGHLDLVVTHTLPNSQGILSKKLFSEHFRFVVHKSLLDGPIKKRCFEEDFLRTVPAISYTRELMLLGRWYRACGVGQNITPRIVCEDWTIIGRMVNSANGYSILPSQFPLNPDVETCDIPENIIKGASFYLIFRKELKGSNLVKSFTDA